MRKLVLGTALLALGACGGDNSNEVGVVFGNPAEEAATEEAYEAAEGTEEAPEDEEYAAEAAEDEAEAE